MTILWRTGCPPPGTPCDNVACTLAAAITYQEGPAEASICTPHAIGLEFDCRREGAEIITVKESP